MYNVGWYSWLAPCRGTATVDNNVHGFVHETSDLESLATSCALLAWVTRRWAWESVGQAGGSSR